MPDPSCASQPEIRHYQQHHAQIWVKPLDGDSMHVAVGNRDACACIILTGEVCARLFAPASGAQHAPT